MRIFLGFVIATCALAQAPRGVSVPLINPRAVVDYFRPTLAPATVAVGGILQIGGTNLGPASPVAETTATLPTTLGNPPVQAMLNGTPMPLFSVSANKILAQVPYDAPTGTVSITVSVGGILGPAAIATVVASQPSIETVDGSGTGVYTGSLVLGTITLEVSGLGATRPALVAGQLPGKGGAVPTTALIAYVGGVRTTATSTASATHVGIFDVRISVPETAQAGDLIYLVAAGRASNGVLYQPLSAPVVSMQPLPAGTPAIAGVTTPDLTGSFLIPYTAADAGGCSAVLWFDMAGGQSGTMSPCLAPPSRVATVPLILPANSEVAGGLVGPPAAAAPAGVSATVVIADADNDSVNSVSLAGAASALGGTTDATFLATIPGPPAETQTINGITDAVNTLAAGGGGGGGGAAAAPTSVNVNGLTAIVTTPVALGAGQYGVVVADDPVVPAQAAYAVVQSNGNVVASQNFPAGWLPLIPTMPSPASANVLAATHLDTTGQNFYVLARGAGASQDAFLAFAENGASAPSVLKMPSGWYAASCDGTVRLTVTTFSPSLVLAGTNRADTSYRNPCGSGGFVVLNLAAQTVMDFPLGMGNQMAVSSIANFNDFIYATNTTPSTRNTADAIYVLDAASFAEYAIQLPAGSISFSGQQTVAGSNWLLATVTNKTAGDGGLVLFDLAQATATVLPIPSGFSAMELVGTFLATNKLVARGLVTGLNAYQLLVFDLSTGDVTAVANPQGVASFGALSATTAAAARLPGPVANSKANTVSGVAYDANGNQLGVLLAMIP